MDTRPLVLLVDDNDATCTLIKAVLQHEFSVDVANDGGEAIEKLRTNRYQAVLLDLRMPHVDGFEVLAFLRRHDPTRVGSVIVVTAALTTKELDRLREYDLCAVVRKPFEIDALQATVRKCAAPKAESAIVTILSSGMIIILAELLR